MKKHDSSTQKTTSKRLTPISVALLYAAFAALWIIAFGKLLAFTVDDAVLQGRIELAEGLIFVAVTSSLLYLLLKGWHGTEESVTTVQDDGIRSLATGRLILLIASLMLVVPLIGVTITTLYSSQIEREAYTNLEAIAKLKAEQIENWLSERQGDSLVLMSSEDLIKHIEEFTQKQTTASREAIQKHFDTLRTSYGYDSLMLFNINGQLLFASGTDMNIPADLQALLRQSLSSKQVQRGDFYRDEQGYIHLDWAIPIFVTDAQGEHAIASVVLRTNSQRFLFPLIQTWPTTSPSAETLLVRRDGEYVLFLNTLRHRTNTALSLRLPLNQPELLAAIAILSGRQGITQSFDYRHVEVLAAYRPIKDTNWTLIAKVDRDEVLSPLHELVLWVSLIAFIAVVVISIMLLMLWLWQQAQNRMLLAQKEKLSIADNSLQQSMESSQALMNAALDAVVSMDQHGKVTAWNPQAEVIFGYSPEQAIGREVAELIVPPAHRQGIARFIKMGTKAILGKHVETLGMRADGTEFPIELTVLELTQNHEQFFTAYIRDISARKQMEQELRDSNAFNSSVLNSLASHIAVLNAQGIIIAVNKAWRQFGIENGLPESSQWLLGASYLDTCKKAVNQPYGDEAYAAQLGIAAVLAGEQEKFYLEYPCHSPNQQRWFSMNVSPLLGTRGGCVINHKNITEHKQHESVLVVSEARYRSLFNNMPEGLAYCRMFYEQGIAQDFVYLEVNPAFEKLTGFKDVIGKKVSEVIPGIRESDPALFDFYGRVALTGKAERFELYVKSVRAWFSISAYSPEIDYFVTIFDRITERKKMEEALIASEKEFRLLAESMPQIVWVSSAEGQSIYHNQQWADYTGLSLEERYGNGWNKTIYPDDQKRTWDVWQNAINTSTPYSLECQLRRADGSYRWWLVRGTPIFDEHKKVCKWFGTCTDIHEIKEAEKALRDSESRLQFILQTNHIGVWDLNLVDHSGHRTLEHARIFGYESLLPEWSYQTFIDHVLPEDREQLNNLIKNAITAQTNWDFECRIRRVDGEVRWIWGSGKYLLDDDSVPHISGIVQDITERKKAEETIYELGYYDPLTRLPNRRLMLDRLKQALISRKLQNRYGAILFIDLNHFKTLNDTKGHDIGDLLLIEVTKHLQAAVHRDDTVARVGGDEFVVILDLLDMVTDLAAAQAESVAKRILVAISLPFNLQGYEYRCSASIGIALFHSYEISIDDLVKQADMAMDQAKQVGGNAISFFDPAIQTALEFRVQLEAWMHKALQEEYRLYFQIQVDDKGKAMGAEALIRWDHPEQGIISPADFIPLAEETGLIIPIGHWVLETACTQLKVWEQNQNTRHLILAVNVSAKQFNQPDFVRDVLAVLDQTGANPDKLKLELTESMLAHNVEDIIAKMNILKVHGVKFSLDDFGTGFSSLSYLKRLPFNQLKIDQSFVRDALTDPNDAAIIRTIIDLGQSLGMDIIAEGVETEQQQNFLAAHGCKHYQGYLFSKPLPLEAFEQLLCNKT